MRQIAPVRVLGSLLGFVGCVVSSNAFAANAQLALSVTEKEVVVRGATPNAPVVIFGVSNEAGPYYATLSRVAKSLIADHDGSVAYEVSGGVPRRSTWFAVDTRTGEYSFASPASFTPRPFLSPPTIALGADASLDLFEVMAEYADILIVQPGRGAWIDSIAKGSSKDLNRTGRKLRVGATSLRSFDKTTNRVGRPTPADVIVIIDPHTMSFYAGRLARP